MQYKVEVVDKPGIFDAVGQGVKKDILDLGIKGVKDVKFIQVYIIRGSLSESQAARICEELLSDKVSQDYLIRTFEEAPSSPGKFTVEIAYNPGVMDPAEASVLKGIQDLGITGAESVSTAKKYIISGKISPAQLKTIADKLLYNKLIQHVVNPACAQALGLEQPGYSFRPVTVDLLGAKDAGLLKISKKRQLFLNLEEMRTLQLQFQS